MSEELVISVLMSILWPFTQNKIPVVCGSLMTVPVLCLHLTQSAIPCLSDISVQWTALKNTGTSIHTFHPKVSLAFHFPEEVSSGQAEKASGPISNQELHSSTWPCTVSQEASAGSRSQPLPAANAAETLSCYSKRAPPGLQQIPRGCRDHTLSTTLQALCTSFLGVRLHLGLIRAVKPSCHVLVTKPHGLRKSVRYVNCVLTKSLKSLFSCCRSMTWEILSFL